MHAEVLDHHVHDAVVIVEQLVQNGNDDHGGDEMRRIADHLHQFLEPGMPAFVEQDGKHNGNGKTHGNGKQGV
jgi:hypothetical protein